MKSKLFSLLAITTMCYLPADTYQEYMTCPAVPQTEFEQLTVILSKYCNNLWGVPPIHCAILQNDIPAIDLLLKYGASPFTISLRDDLSCIHYAIKAGSLELTKKFVELGAPLNGGDVYRDPLSYAKYCNQPEIVRYLESLRR